MTTNAEVERTWEIGPLSVTVEFWSWRLEGTVRLSAYERRESGMLVLLGVVFLDHSEETWSLVDATINGRCAPPILADWVEEHRELWRCPGETRDSAAAVICMLLRATDHMSGEPNEDTR